MRERKPLETMDSNSLKRPASNDLTTDSSRKRLGRDGSRSPQEYNQNLHSAESQARTRDIRKMLSAYRYTEAEDDGNDGYDDHEYRIVRNIGNGSYGVVSEVRHRMKSRGAFARKEIKSTSDSNKQILQEIDLIQQARHTHVVQIVEHYSSGGVYNIVMTPMAEKNLAQFLHSMTSDCPKTETSWQIYGKQRQQVYSWIYCLVSALHHIHGLNIRHRDIKPENILVHGENVLLTDFGISFAQDGITEQTVTSTLGTLRYEPPEAKISEDQEPEKQNRVYRNRVGRDGDIFMMGAVIYEMLEALLQPLFPGMIPHVEQSYSACISDEAFRAKVHAVKESTRRLEKLPQNHRYSGLLEQWLAIILHSMLQKSPASRIDASRIYKALYSSEVELLGGIKTQLCKRCAENF